MKTSSAAVDATRESHLNAVQLPHHFELIDTGRGFCALTILVFHFRHFLMPEAGAPLPETDLGALPFHAILRPLYQYGLYAVHAFWLISGFVFSHVYGDGKVRQGHIYALNRFSRLYPLHFVTLVTVAILQAISYYQLGYFQIYANNDTCRFILHIFFASNWWLQEVDSFNAPIWSVSVEVLVYVIFFFSARHAIGRTGMATAALATTGFALFWVTKLIVFYCMGCFYVGAVIYVLNRRAVMISPGVCLRRAYDTRCDGARSADLERRAGAACAAIPHAALARASILQPVSDPSPRDAGVAAYSARRGTAAPRAATGRHLLPGGGGGHVPCRRAPVHPHGAAAPDAAAPPRASVACGVMA